MPLSDQHKHLLHEIYGIPYSNQTAIAGDVYTRTVPMIAEAFVELQTHLLAAIDRIDSDETMVQRVGEILQKYSDLDLDPSNIDRDGYSLRYQKSIRTLQKALFPYTSIRAGDRSCNSLRLG